MPSYVLVRSSVLTLLVHTSTSFSAEGIISVTSLAAIQRTTNLSEAGLIDMFVPVKHGSHSLEFVSFGRLLLIRLGQAASDPAHPSAIAEGDRIFRESTAVYQILMVKTS